MLAYAAHQKSHRRLKPSTLLLIGAGHAVAIGLLITAKMDVTIFPEPGKTTIYDVPITPPPPKPPEPQQKVERDTVLPPPPQSFVDRTPPALPLPQPSQPFEVGPNIPTQLPDIGEALGNSLGPSLPPQPLPAIEPVKIAARPITPADLLRPPYPESKRRTEEEAVLRLRLSIDPRGRVTAVEPVGNADPAFVAEARKHLLRHWRYRPATEDGRAVASSLIITLRFELEE